MNDMAIPTVTAAPDGGAELRLVVRLDWQRVAELGFLASELASELKRPVTLDEAVSHQLAFRTRPVAPAHGTVGTTPTTTVMPLSGAAAVEAPGQAPVAAGKQAGPASLESGPSGRPAAVASGQSPAQQATASAQVSDKNAHPLVAAG
ncbi:hypothetical protein [Kitasatospora aureofaciens]|uniref:hypothetical protein n=1 Tax=Kitasatospora aureofaciens TaxID=1894 RepID=UPI001C443B41|nr:hypothetical protein [Kitasatospora aureofaciens]MBV6702813.1 hypothetical protein [Kitasatospora aureofaciens]